MKKSFRLLTLMMVLFALVACEPEVLDSITVTFKNKIKEYDLNQKVTPGMIMNEVILNKEYMEIIGLNLELNRIEIYGSIDTSKPGKIKIPFNFANLEGNPIPNSPQLYCYIYIRSNSEVEQPTEVPIPLKGISFNPSEISCNKETYQLNPIFDPLNTNQQDLIYAASPESVATVDENGLVTRKDFGTVTITATSYYLPEVKATVSIKFIEENIPITGATIRNGAEVVSKDNSPIQLQLDLNPTDTTNTEFTWEANNDTVIVSANGLVTIKEGLETAEATITATNKAVSSITASINVKFGVPIESVNINQGESINVSSGKTTNLSYSVTPADTTNTRFEWITNNTQITVSDEGVVTYAGNAEYAEATITLKNLTNETVTDTINVSFGRNTAITAVEIQEGAAIRTLERSQQLNLTLTPADTTNTTFNWTASNQDVTISDNGLVSLKEGVIGTQVTIMATNQAVGSVSDSIEITFDALAAESVVLKGNVEDKTLTKIIAANFETEADPSTITIEGTRQDGYAKTNNDRLSLWFKRSEMQGFKYIEFRIKNNAHVNVWMRAENTLEITNPAPGQAGTPITCLRYNDGWKEGWNDDGGMATGFQTNNEFHTIGFYLDGNTVHCYYNRQHKSQGVVTDFIAGINNSDFDLFRIQSEGSNAAFDYVAIYK